MNLDTDICKCDHRYDDHGPSRGLMACAASAFCECKNFAKKMIEYKNLGIENGWKDYPIEYIECSEAGHKQKREVIGTCLNLFSCAECKIYYTVDSSG